VDGSSKVNEIEPKKAFRTQIKWLINFKTWKEHDEQYENESKNTKSKKNWRELNWNHSLAHDTKW